MAVNLITYAEQTVLPKYDAIVYEHALSSGLFYGCEVTVSGNYVYVSSGYGIINGRFFQMDATTVSATLPTSSKSGQVYLNLDLSNTTEPLSVEVEIASTLSTLTQSRDANYEDGVYQYQLATFTASSTELSDVVTTSTTLTRFYPLGEIVEILRDMLALGVFTGDVSSLKSSVDALIEEVDV